MNETLCQFPLFLCSDLEAQRSCYLTSFYATRSLIFSSNFVLLTYRIFRASRIGSYSKGFIPSVYICLISLWQIYSLRSVGGVTGREYSSFEQAKGFHFSRRVTIIWHQLLGLILFLVYTT